MFLFSFMIIIVLFSSSVSCFSLTNISCVFIMFLYLIFCRTRHVQFFFLTLSFLFLLYFFFFLWFCDFAVAFFYVFLWGSVIRGKGYIEVDETSGLYHGAVTVSTWSSLKVTRCVRCGSVSSVRTDSCVRGCDRVFFIRSWLRSRRSSVSVVVRSSFAGIGCGAGNGGGEVVV